MNATRTLAVPGATLHYEVTGTGPVLLVSPSGHNGSRQGVDLARRLADACTVVTYDRRGLARSTVDDPGRPVTMAAHVDDAHRLLAAVTDEPAFMLGCSFGALIGLHLAAEHPGRLAALVAHEPVAPALLPAAERARHEEELAHLQRVLREKGMAAALAEIAHVLGIDPARETEPGLTPHPMTPERAADFRHFVEHDFDALLADTFDPRSALGTGVRVVPAVGRTTPGAVFDRRCAEELAKALGTEPAEFPGGHNGDLSHPGAYAARLREVLEPSRATV